MPEIPEPIDFSIQRPRTLDTEVRGSERSRDTIEVRDRNREQGIDRIYSSYKYASDKANAIMKQAAEVAKKYTIPVPNESVELRQSVIRQDPDSNGDKITFELFMNMIDIVEKQATKVDYIVIDTHVKADPAANERLIRKQIDSRLGNDEDGLLNLLLAGGHIATLYIMHLIQGMWRGPEAVLGAPKTAGALPTEPASPLGEAVAEMAIGLATAQTVLGINEILANIFLENGVPRASSTSTVSGAIGEARQIDLPPLLQQIQKVEGLNDHKSILKYSTKYIGETQDRGYEFWWAYLIARRTRYFSGRAISSAPMFSKKEYSSKNYNFTTDNAQIQPDDIVLNEPTNLDGFTRPGFIDGLTADLIRGLNESVVTPTDDFSILRDYEASSFEQGLNFLAQVMDTRLSRDVICCFVRFLGNVDVDMLRKIRALLHIMSNNYVVDLSTTIENYNHFLTSWVRETAMSLIFELMQGIMDKIVTLVYEFTSDLEADIQFLETCPLIMDLLQGLIDAIDMILLDIRELVANYTTAIRLSFMVSFGLQQNETDYASGQPGLLLIHKKRTMHRMLTIIDGIINVLEDFSLCDEEELEDHTNNDGKKVLTFDQVVDSPFMNDIEDYLGVPEDVKEKYFSDAAEIILSDGTHLPAYAIGEHTLWTRAGGDVMDCLPLFSRTTMEKLLTKRKEPGNV